MTKKQTTSDFFDPSYKMPNKQDQFARLAQGANKFRFIGKSVTGYEFFVEVDGKPVKLTKKDPFTKDELDNLASFKESKPRYFMACCVYEYASDSFKLLSLTQNSILSAIRDAIQNPDYGDIHGYDITITKKGEALATEYSVLPSPPKPLAEPLLKLSQLLDYDLNLLFEGEYPASTYPFEKGAE